MGASTRFGIDRIRHEGDEPYLLREIVRTYQVLMHGFTRKVGMPASRLALMRLLANSSPHGAGIMEIARQLGINAAAVTRLVQGMEKERLVLRRSDAGDGRRSYVRLSARGFRAFEEIHDRSHELERSLSSAIGIEEVNVAAKVLSMLRGMIANLS